MMKTAPPSESSQPPSPAAEKNAAADATNPILLTSPARVSPPPSYSSGSFRRCDTKQPSKCLYCGSGAKSPGGGYWTPPPPAEPSCLERSRKTAKGVAILASIALAITLLTLWLFGTHPFFIYHRPFNSLCRTNFIDEGRPRFLAQEMEIDTEKLYEKIEVPRFGSNRPAIFVHDFRKNITAIVDILGDRCFIRPLDRASVFPPRNFIDLVKKMETGYYVQNPRVIHETFGVGSQLSEEDVVALGSVMVSQQCANRDVYQLISVGRASDAPYFVRDKRAANPRPQTPNGDIQFSVLSGDQVQVERIIL